MFFIEFLVGIGLALLAHNLAIVMLGNTLESNESTDQFVINLLGKVYFYIGLVVAVWIVAGPASMFFTIFMTSYMFTILRLDFSSVARYYKEEDL